MLHQHNNVHEGDHVGHQTVDARREAEVQVDWPAVVRAREAHQHLRAHHQQHVHRDPDDLGPRAHHVAVPVVWVALEEVVTQPLGELPDRAL